MTRKWLCNSHLRITPITSTKSSSNISNLFQLHPSSFKKKWLKFKESQKGFKKIAAKWHVCDLAGEPCDFVRAILVSEAAKHDNREIVRARAERSVSRARRIDYPGDSNPPKRRRKEPNRRGERGERRRTIDDKSIITRLNIVPMELALGLIEAAKTGRCSFVKRLDSQSFPSPWLPQSGWLTFARSSRSVELAGWRLTNENSTPRSLIPPLLRLPWPVSGHKGKGISSFSPSFRRRV